MELELPKSIEEIVEAKWSQLESLYQTLIAQEINALNVETWLSNWSRISEIVSEQYNRLYVATTANTADKNAEQKLKDFLDNAFTHSKTYEQQLIQKLLKSNLIPEGMEIPIHNMRAESELYREANTPLLTEEQKLATEYDKIVGAQTYAWNGEQYTFMQMHKVLVEDGDRLTREKAWRVVRKRLLADKDFIHASWRQSFNIRQQIAQNADMPDYRAYIWKYRLRFAYTPEDCKTFHAAVEEVAVPAATRIYERRRRIMGLKSLRPWDLNTDPFYRPALKPFNTIEELTQGALKIFDRINPTFGNYFRAMITENLLDLDSRINKVGGAYCASYEYTRKPFIFANSVGIHLDVHNLLHEAGHAFHAYEENRLPYIMQLNPPMEFNEVISIGMELLAMPYLAESGMYTPEEATRAQLEFLEELILAWPFISLVDMFQHWIYENPQEGSHPERCDAKWVELHKRFLPAVDINELEELVAPQWHRLGHIHQTPFYFIDYGIAQLGAVQIWNNSFVDRATAISDYRKALQLGAIPTLPKLFETAGAKFSLDMQTLKTCIDLLETQINTLNANTQT